MEPAAPVSLEAPALDRAHRPVRRILDVEGVDAYYGEIQALRGLSLHVGDREMVALVGANGAGKTTTLRVVSGLLHPRRGSVTFEGRPVQDLYAQALVRRGVAHVPEGRDLFPGLTVTENLQLGHWVRRRTGGFRRARDRVMDYFPKLRQRAGQAAGTLSGGEQQMLVIARALMSDPTLLIVDELSLGLAPIVVQQLFDILRTVNAAGTSILLVEQFVEIALQNTHRAYALAKGEVAMEGNSDELLRNPALVSAYLGGSDDAAAAD